MKSISLLIALSFLTAAASAVAPAPAADCSGLVISMVDCLSFVTNNSTVKKPQGTCCTGLKSVLKSNPECLCEAFKNSAQLGVSLNITKALTLPAACHVSSPDINNCQGIGAAPAMSPKGAMSPKAAAGTTPSTGGAATKLAPSPSPKSSSASGLTASLGSVIALSVALMISCF